MTESTRNHERIEESYPKGVSAHVLWAPGRSAELFVPEQYLHSASFDLLFHFHGAGFVSAFAADKFPRPLVAVTINLGSGSSRYDNGFLDTASFPAALDSVRAALNTLHLASTIDRIYLSGWSAGYGAVRRILSTESNYAKVTGVLLLDGIHASYVPERTVLAEGGAIDTNDIAMFLRLARDAEDPRSSKQFLITHSEVFPGTFVSTTEATDYLMGQLGMVRTPVLEWGPLGMQLLSRARRGHFEVLGFAGNSAQDHVDHLHSLFYFLDLLSNL